MLLERKSHFIPIIGIFKKNPIEKLKQLSISNILCICNKLIQTDFKQLLIVYVLLLYS